MSSIFNQSYDDQIFIDIENDDYRNFNQQNFNQGDFNQSSSRYYLMNEKEEKGEKEKIEQNNNNNDQNESKNESKNASKNETQNESKNASSLLSLNDEPPLEWQHIPEIEQHGMDIFLIKLYRYYLHGGYWNILASHLAQMGILIFFVVFCLFIFTDVDYRTLMSYNNHNTTYLFQNVISGGMTQLNGYYIICLVLFSLYVVWKLIRIALDAKNMIQIKRFYQNNLNITDFELQTIRWTTVVDALNRYCSSHGYTSMAQWDINSRIMKKDNYLLALIHHGILHHALPLGPSQFRQFLQHHLRTLREKINISFEIPKFKLKVFGKILIWSINYCIINFIVDDQNQLHRDIMSSESLHVKNDLIHRMQKRIRIMGLLNFLLLPFIVIFVPIYILFQYGEEFYKNPGNASARNWSFFSRWKFREYNELQHTFKTRMHVTSKYAEQYLKQFPYGIYEHIGRLTAFMTSSFIIYFFIISICNDIVLFNMNLAFGKSVFWWLGFLTTVWVISRTLIRQQPVYFPEKKMGKLETFLHNVPDKIKNAPHSKQSVMWLKKYFQYKMSSLCVEMISILLNPFILVFILGSYDNLSAMIDYIRTNTTNHPTIGQICTFSAFDQHVDILDFGLGVDKKMEQSIAHYKNTLRGDIVKPHVPSMNLEQSVFSPTQSTTQSILDDNDTFHSCDSDIGFINNVIMNGGTMKNETINNKQSKNEQLKNGMPPMNMSEYLVNELDQNSVLLHESGTNTQTLYNILSQNKYK